MCFEKRQINQKNQFIPQMNLEMNKNMCMFSLNSCLNLRSSSIEFSVFIFVKEDIIYILVQVFVMLCYIQLFILLDHTKSQQIYIRKMEQNLLNKFRNYQEYIAATAILKQKFEQQKNTIILFSVQNFIGEILKKIAKWMLGATLTLVKKQGYPVSNDANIKQTELKLSLNNAISIIENKSTRIITFRFSPSYELVKQDDKNDSQKVQQQNKNKDEQKVRQLANYIFALGAIYNLHKGSKLKICGAIKSGDDSQSIINKMKKLFGTQNLFLVKYPSEEQQQEDSQTQLIIQKNDGNKSHGPKSLDNIFSNMGQNYSLKSFFKNQFIEHLDDLQRKARTLLQKLVIAEIQKVRQNVTSCLSSLLSPCTKICQKVLFNNDEDNIPQIYSSQINSLKQWVEALNNKEIQDQINKIKLQDLGQKIDKSIAYKYFVLQIFSIKNAIQQEQTKKKLANSQLIKKLFAKITSLLQLVPLEIRNEDLRYFKAYASFAVQQYQILTQISQNLFYYQLYPLYMALGIKKNEQDYMSSKEIQQIIMEEACSLQLQKYQSPHYYDYFSSLIQKCFHDFDERGIKNLNELKQKQSQFQLLTPIYRLQSLLYNKQSSPITKLKGIQQFFAVYLGAEQYFNIESIFTLFKTIGCCLRDLGLPELAIQIYKKIKFQKQVELCFNDIMKKNNYFIKAQEYGASKYFEMAAYFQSIGNLNKANLYGQLAFETCPDMSYFNQMTNFKKSYYRNQINQEVINIVTGVAQKKLPQQAYFNYKFPEQFSQAILRATQLYEQQQVNLTVQVSMEELKQFSFFSDETHIDQ